MKKTLACTPFVAGLVLLPCIAAAQVREVWQTRLIEAVQQMGQVEEQFGPDRLRLTESRTASVQRTKPLREGLIDAEKKAHAACQATTDKACLEARSAAQEAHLGLTENMSERLQIEAQIVDKNFQYSMRMTDLLATVVVDIEGSIRKGGEQGGPNGTESEIDKVAKRTQSFLSRALPALQSAADVAGATAKTMGDTARLRAAQDVARAIHRFRSDLNGSNASKTPLERLSVLKARFEAFAAINRQARMALETNAQNLRAVNALAATSLAEDMLGSFQGGLAEYGPKFTDDIDESLDAYQQDFTLLMDTVMGPKKSGDDSFFRDAGSSYFDK